MNKIIWKGDRFECSSPELEGAKWQVLASNHLKLRDFMVCYDLRLDEFICHADRSITILKLKEDLSFAEFPIADEGAGFNICFHLGAYAIASMNLGQKLEICAYSFKPLLHPVLFQGLGKWFRDRRSSTIDRKCPYFSGSYELKCAVNPSLPCNECAEASASFRENLFVWTAADLGDRIPSGFDWFKAIEDTVNQGRGFDEMRQAFWAAQESMRSQMVEIPRMVIGVDEGSGQDTTAIAMGLTTEDGTILTDGLEIRANISEAEAKIEVAITKLQVAAHKLLDQRLLDVCQHGLSDHITPLPPRLEEERQRYTEERKRARIWSHFEGVVVYPQPHRMPTPQELYGLSTNTEEDLSSRLGLSPEEMAEHKANGTLFAELHRRWLLKRNNRLDIHDENIQG